MVGMMIGEGDEESSAGESAGGDEIETQTSGTPVDALYERKPSVFCMSLA